MHHLRDDLVAVVVRVNAVRKELWMEGRGCVDIDDGDPFVGSDLLQHGKNLVVQNRAADLVRVGIRMRRQRQIDQRMGRKLREVVHYRGAVFPKLLSPRCGANRPVVRFRVVGAEHEDDIDHRRRTGARDEARGRGVFRLLLIRKVADRKHRRSRVPEVHHFHAGPEQCLQHAGIVRVRRRRSASGRNAVTNARYVSRSSRSGVRRAGRDQEER